MVFLIENPSIILKRKLITISNYKKGLSTDIISLNWNTTFKNKIDRKLPLEQLEVKEAHVFKEALLKISA